MDDFKDYEEITVEGLECRLFIFDVNFKYGLINEEKDLILEAKYKRNFEIEKIDKNCFKLKNDGKVGIINKKGEILLPLEYEKINNIENTVFFSYAKNKKIGLISSEGKALSSLTFDDIFFLKDVKLFLITDDDKFGFANINGEITIHPELNSHYIDYEKINNIFKKYKVFEVKKDDKYGLVDNKGEYIISPEYDAIDMINKELFYLLYRDENNYGKVGLAIYSTGKMNLVFSKKVPIDNVHRVSKNIIEFKSGAFGAGLVTNDGEILLESKNPFTFSKKKAKIIEQYG